MPLALRSRLALFALLATFLIPIGLSSLRGLTQVVICEEEQRRPFTLVIPERGNPTLATSTFLERGKQQRLCGSLELNMQARPRGRDKVEMLLPITNTSRFLWRGTVRLQLGQTSLPVAIGEIPAGPTARDEVEFRLDPGTHDLSGSLLVGP